MNPADSRYRQVYHLDLRTRRFRMCSIDAGGQPGVGNSGFASVSADGRFVAFRRDPTVEAAGSSELWVYDVVAESARQLAGISAGGWPARPELSDDGKSIVFVSEAANLVSDDSNGTFDVLWMPLSSNDPTDSDGDGLLDGWENAHFRNLSETATGDPDGDGVTNVFEFESGTDPTDPLSLFRLAWSRGDDADPTLCWQSAGGIVYVVERAAASVASGFRPVSPEIPGDGTPVCLPIRPSAASSGFFRVRLRRTD
ncbi:MAG: PD40 domain-containing protein [Verrucomicrobiales bacterium]|nr:PD40 domain-containing protein [Verrucomicrobiales bacterium]